MKIVNVDGKNLQIFYTIFIRKDVADNNIKSHKKRGLHPVSRRYSFEKTTGGSN